MGTTEFSDGAKTALGDRTRELSGPMSERFWIERCIGTCTSLRTTTLGSWVVAWWGLQFARNSEDRMRGGADFTQAVPKRERKTSLSNRSRGSALAELDEDAGAVREDPEATGLRL
ncbi:MAG TPA: hypothetical protein PKE00_00285, partial [Planctomycetota bacterium]|nr:hypothetical protein [Planctomycetota bacterium]